MAVVHRCTHRSNARLTFFDRGDPCPTVGAEQNPAARALIKRQNRAGGNDRAQPVRRLQGGETDTGVALPHEKLRGFTGGVTELREGGASRLSERPPCGSGLTERDESGAECEPGVMTSTQKAVNFEGRGEAVGGGPTQAGALDEFVERRTAALDRTEDQGGFVDDTHTAYT